MKKLTLIIFVSLAYLQMGVSDAFSQTLGKVSSVSVQISQAIDSTKAASGAKFNGTVVNQVTTPQGTTIAAGTAAVVALTETSVAGTNTWTLTLVSPAPGKVASLGGAIGSVTSRLGGFGIGGFGKKTNPAPAANSAESTGGARVYVPANTQVRFILDQASTPAAPGQVTQAPAQTSSSPLASAALTNGQPASTAAANPQSAAAGRGKRGSQAASGAGRGAAATSPATGTAAAGSTTVVWGDVQYVLQGCQRQAPHISCQVQITNLAAADASLITTRATYYVDQAGNKVMLNSASAANCNLFQGCLALNGLPMAGTFVFLDEDSKSTSLIRFEIESRAGPVQFTNVKVE